MAGRILWTFVAVAELWLLIIVLTITVSISPRTALVAGLALCLLGLFAAFTGRGFRRLRGRIKGASVAAIAGFIALIATLPTVAEREARWADLRQSDPDAYLEELAPIDRVRWLEEVRDLRPDQYEHEVARIEAAATAQQRGETVEAAGQAADERATIATEAQQARATAGLQADDFYWDSDTRRYESQIVEIVNRIRDQHPRCRDADPQSVALSTSRSAPGAPVFFVTCGQMAEAFNLWFSPDDANNGRRFGATQPVGRTAAAEACERAARAEATHPSTVSFSRILHMSFTTHASGRARVASRFTARNSFNLELTFSIDCLFDGNSLIEVTILEVPR